jgi:gluconolactonase
MEPLVPLAHASIFFDGTVGEPRLNHPEGVAVDPEGNVWCGGETGEIYRIAADGSTIEQIAATGGFTLGIAFGPGGELYTCDLAHKIVYRLDPNTKQLARFAGGPDNPIQTPNYPVVDAQRNCLYVSDSHSLDTPGPRIWRFDLTSGAGGPWYDAPLNFANGLALSSDRNWLYVVETFGHRISRIPIAADGSAGAAELFVDNIDRLPDGLAFDVQGNLYISCYEPSRLYRATPTGELQLLIDDPDAHTFCHPTNCAFRGPDLFTANLGRWHITRIDVGSEGAPLI